MQILLTQQEYDDLVNARKKAFAEVDGALQDLCTKVCDHMPVSVKWIEDGKPQPWGCILTHGEDGNPDDDWYCDHCPVQKVCPGQKHYSK